MKVLFFPHYLYLQYEPFRRTIGQLRTRGVDAYLVPMYAAWLDERRTFGNERFAHDQCPAKALPLVRAGLKGESVFQRASRFPRFLVNRSRIQRFLRTQKPDVVVLGSDLGGVYIRVVQDCCRQYEIPVVIVATVDVVEDRNAAQEIPLVRPARMVLQALRMERTLLFNHWVLGTYLDDSVIAVPGPLMKERLVAAGIASHRIHVTGNPAHDRFYELRHRPHDSIWQTLSGTLPEGITGPLITYCSETIDEVYGLPYLKYVNEMLSHIVSVVAPEWQLVAKLHPRESRRAVAAFEEAFRGSRCRVIHDIDLYQLISVSDLVIAHFSHLIKEAVLAGTPVLSLDLLNDGTRRSLMPPIEDAVAHSEAELVEKLRGLLRHGEKRRAVMEGLERWQATFALPLDGAAAARVADLIAGVAKR